MTTPFWSSDNGETHLAIYQGDALETLRQMPAESVHCVVTSPPYWGLRDYKHDGQIGLERTPEEYVGNLVAVFREVRRVLRKDGTVWLVLGDSYTSAWACDRRNVIDQGSPTDEQKRPNRLGGVLKEKDMVGIPWRVAFALQADGWWLRSDIIWAKPNPMPESVTDRPTKSHEYIFLLTKAERYFYDADAIREESVTQDPRRPYTSEGAWQMDGRPKEQRYGGVLRKQDALGKATYTGFNDRYRENPVLGRNKRTVWEIAPEPYPEAHFAVYPTELVKPCILAGTSEKGCCPECGAPWERETERISTGKRYAVGKSEAKNRNGLVTAFSGYDDGSSAPVFKTVGWRPTCCHGKEIPIPQTLLDNLEIEPYPPIPCTVLDPFSGSGTTLLVAQRLGRSGIGIELSADYCALAVRRLEEHAQQRLPL